MAGYPVISNRDLAVLEPCAESLNVVDGVPVGRCGGDVSRFSSDDGEL